MSTARTAAEQAAAILGARLTPILDSAKVHAARGVAACQPFGAQIAGIISEKCPVCVSTAEAVARRAGGLAEAGGGMLARWHAASGTGELTAPPSSELYHGATLLRGLPQQLGAVKASLTKQISQMVGGAAPAWATETASRLRTRVIGAWTVWTGLLEQSAAAVQPEPMRAAAKHPPRGEAGHLAEAARRAGAWFGSFIGSKTAPPAEQPPAEKAEDIPDALAAPAQTHVLRWPGTQVGNGDAPSEALQGRFEHGKAARDSERAVETDASGVEVPEQPAPSQQEEESGSEAAEAEFSSKNSPCSGTKQCTHEDASEAADHAKEVAETDADVAAKNEDEGQNLDHDEHIADSAAPSSVAPSADSQKAEEDPSLEQTELQEPAQPVMDGGPVVAEPEDPATAVAASQEMQPAKQSEEARESAVQTIEPAESAEAEAPTHADSSKMSDGQAQEVRLGPRTSVSCSLLKLPFSLLPKNHTWNCWTNE